MSYREGVEWLTVGCDESLPTTGVALFASALPLDANVVGMDQHL